MPTIRLAMSLGSATEVPAYAHSLRLFLLGHSSWHCRCLCLVQSSRAQQRSSSRQTGRSSTPAAATGCSPNIPAGNGEARRRLPRGDQDAGRLERQKDEYRRQLFEMLGLDPLPEKTDLKPVVTGKVEHEEFTVEKLHFQSRPGLYVTGNLYLPKKLDRSRCRRSSTSAGTAA